METGTLTRMWATFTAELEPAPGEPDQWDADPYPPTDEIELNSSRLDAETFRQECQTILDGGTVNYDLGRGRFTGATLGAELRDPPGHPRRFVLCEWTPDEGWRAPLPIPPAAVLLAAHHRPATAFELAAYGDLLLDLHLRAPDGRCPAWCVECAEASEDELCGSAAAANEVRAL